MKKINKKLICIALAVSMCAGFVACSSSKAVDSEATVVTSSSVNSQQAGENSQSASNSENSSSEQSSVAETDKGSSTVTATSKTTKSNSKATTKKSKKSETTTKETVVYTTVDDDAAIELPELPDDGYEYSESLAMYALQQYYGNDYVVNTSDAKGDIEYFNVIDKKESTIYATVKVDLKSGSIKETIKETGKTKKLNIS
jgi:hypothetical protein